MCLQCSSHVHHVHVPCTYLPPQAQQEVARSLELQRAVAEAEAGRVELGRRMQASYFGTYYHHHQSPPHAHVHRWRARSMSSP